MAAVVRAKCGASWQVLRLEVVRDARGDRVTGASVAVDTLFQHSLDIVGSAGTGAADGGLADNLHLHQADRFALVAYVANLPAGFLHYLREDDLAGTGFSLGEWVVMG